MVQMILARRRTPLFGVEFSSEFCVLSSNCSPRQEGLALKRRPQRLRPRYFSFAWRLQRPLIYGKRESMKTGSARDGARKILCIETACPNRDDHPLVELIAVSSFPNMARGNSKALNSAPTSTTREIIYIQTSSAMPAPREP